MRNPRRDHRRTTRAHRGVRTRRCTGGGPSHVPAQADSSRAARKSGLPPQATRPARRSGVPTTHWTTSLCPPLSGLWVASSLKAGCVGCARAASQAVRSALVRIIARRRVRESRETMFSAPEVLCIAVLRVPTRVPMIARWVAGTRRDDVWLGIARRDGRSSRGRLRQPLKRRRRRQRDEYRREPDVPDRPVIRQHRRDAPRQVHPARWQHRMDEAE